MTGPVEPPPDPGTGALAIDDAWWPRPPRPGVPFRHTVGVRAVEPAAWLRPRPGDGALLTWKAAVLDRLGDRVFQALPGTADAGTEALAAVSAAVGALTPVAAAGRGRHPLESASRLVAEDLCLIDVRGPDPVLVAGSVAMPSRWLLAAKLGRDVIGVHAPVPGYAEEIGTPTDRLLRGLAGGRVLARAAWTLVDDPALFQPASSSRVERARPQVRTPADAATSLYLRVEYQTVRALPASGAVLFTLRTAREAVGVAARRPGRAAALLAVLESQPPDQLEYKGVTPYLDPLLGLLRSLA